METPPSRQEIPDLSIIMPCYNEEGVIRYTIPKFVEAFEKRGINLELLAVDNGSQDATGTILRELAEKHPSVNCLTVEVNEGYGNGILQAIPACTGPWIGYIPADGQVDAEDVVSLYEAVSAGDEFVLGKVRRRFRMDGPLRKLNSVAYNLLVRILWPRLESIDVNGTPKMLSARVLRSLELESKDWLLDPEVMIKAHYMGIRILEFNAFARMRGGGVSHVRLGACWEFFRTLLVFRFSRKLRAFRHKRVIDAPGPPGEQATHPGQGD